MTNNAFARLVLNFRISTPLFLGGADQRPELRAPSFKGLVRFWYRAVDPQFVARNGAKQGPTKEERFFGGSSNSAGQCPFLLRVEPLALDTLDWIRIQPPRFDPGHGRQTRNGLVYLGFPFGLPGGERSAFAPGQEFTARCTITRKELADDPEFRRALLASWWLLAHIGGAGTRSRRGFGSLELFDWSIESVDPPWPEIKELPLLAKTSEPGEWRSGFSRAVTTLGTWFGNLKQRTPAGHPHLGDDFKLVLSSKGWPRRQWAEALEAMGFRLQQFRDCRPPDYEDLKAMLRPAAGTRGRALHSAPSRSSFGLPLLFRFGSASTLFSPYDPDLKSTRERQGSLLYLRLATVGDRLHPAYFRLAGTVPGVDSQVAIRGQGRGLAPAKQNDLDAFMAEVEREE